MSNYHPHGTAAHELAHAMVGQEVGLEIEKVQVFKTFWSSNTLGVCWPAEQLIPDVDGKPDETVCRALQTTTAAGQMGMQMWYEENLPTEPVPWGGAGDYPYHKREARMLREWGIRPRTWDESMQDARDALTPIWPLVLERIPLLLSRKTLKQKHVRISRKPGLPRR